MGRHSLWHVDVVSVAVVGVHSVWVRRWALVCSSVGKERTQSLEAEVRKGRVEKVNNSRWMLHQPAPLDLNPLQHLVLMEPLHRGPQRRYVVRQALVVCGQVLGQGCAGAREVVGGQWRGRSRGHGVARRMRWEGWMEGHRVGNHIIALRWRLRRKLGGPVRVGTRRRGLMVQRACERAICAQEKGGGG